MNTENNNVISEKKDYFFSEKTGRLFAIGGLIFILVATIFFMIFGNWSFSTKKRLLNLVILSEE